MLKRWSDRAWGLRLALGMIAAGLTAGVPLEAKDLAVGQPAPDFELTTFDGRKLTMADFKQQVLIINFWATWCGPCKRELPLLDAYYRSAKAYGLRVIAVTTEDSVPVNQLKPLAAALEVPLAKRFKGGPYGRVKAVPTNYVIDRNGILRYAQAGALTLDGMNQVLLPLLNEHSAAPDDAVP
jgi:peroxiredoxin